jgi:hypothetical protein
MRGRASVKTALLFEKRSKNFFAWVPRKAGNRSKSFLVLFFKKEPLAYLSAATSKTLPKARAGDAARYQASSARRPPGNAWFSPKTTQ